MNMMHDDKVTLISGDESKREQMRGSSLAEFARWLANIND